MDGEFKLAQNEGEENMNRNDVLFLNWEQLAGHAMYCHGNAGQLTADEGGSGVKSLFGTLTKMGGKIMLS